MVKPEVENPLHNTILMMIGERKNVVLTETSTTSLIEGVTLP